MTFFVYTFTIYAHIRIHIGKRKKTYAQKEKVFTGHFYAHCAYMYAQFYKHVTITFYCKIHTLILIISI